MGRMSGHMIDKMNSEQCQLDDDYDEYCGMTEQQQREQEHKEQEEERKWEAAREDAITFDQSD